MYYSQIIVKVLNYSQGKVLRVSVCQNKMFKIKRGGAIRTFRIKLLLLEMFLAISKAVTVSRHSIGATFPVGGA